MEKVEAIIGYESGHSKRITGYWKGEKEGGWAHFIREDGNSFHGNKDKIEYIETRVITEEDQKKKD